MPTTSVLDDKTMVAVARRRWMHMHVRKFGVDSDFESRRPSRGRVLRSCPTLARCLELDCQLHFQVATGAHAPQLCQPR